MKEPFLPEEFVVPTIFETDRFRLRMLSVEDVVLDYDAVMTSRDHLHSVFGAHTSWPADDMTIEQDLADLRRHQQEFEERIAFAYTVVSLDESLCLGCVYVYPTLSREFYDSRVYLWMRKSELKKAWMRSCLPLSRPGWLVTGPLSTLLTLAVKLIGRHGRRLVTNVTKRGRESSDRLPVPLFVGGAVPENPGEVGSWLQGEFHSQG